MGCGASHSAHLKKEEDHSARIQSFHVRYSSLFSEKEKDARNSEESGSSMDCEVFIFLSQAFFTSTNMFPFGIKHLRHFLQLASSLLIIASISPYVRKTEWGRKEEGGQARGKEAGGGRGYQKCVVIPSFNVQAMFCGSFKF
jgi:hypothetical protein